jgi:tRNA-uridine 2-sulfurtransferase
MSLGADLMATGHYARIVADETEGNRLLKGLDPRKDQSYFLFALSRDQLSKALFPLGEMTKQHVRSLAAEFRLPVADKGESQEICFIADDDYDDYVRFLESERGAGEPGNIVDQTGKVLGSHGGIYRYTVGQRKGLGIAHPFPLYVLGVDPLRNEVVVGAREELFSVGLIASHMNWLVSPPAAPVEAVCKIRYRHHPVACTIRPLPEGKAEIRFAEPEKSVTPGQAAVIYDGETVLGGGWIERSLP